jgi:hypothetical protein
MILFNTSYRKGTTSTFRCIDILLTHVSTTQKPLQKWAIRYIGPSKISSKDEIWPQCRLMLRIRILLIKSWESTITVLKILHCSILSLHASIVSVNMASWLHFEAPQLLNFDHKANPDPASNFDSDPDPAFHSVEDPNPASQHDTDPCGSESDKWEKVATMWASFVSLFQISVRNHISNTRSAVINPNVQHTNSWKSVYLKTKLPDNTIAMQSVILRYFCFSAKRKFLHIPDMFSHINLTVIDSCRQACYEY